MGVGVCVGGGPIATAASRGGRARDRSGVQNGFSFGFRGAPERPPLPPPPPLGASTCARRLGWELVLVDGDEADAEADEPRDAARISAAIASFARSDSLSTCAGILPSAPPAASRSSDASDAIP